MGRLPCYPHPLNDAMKSFSRRSTPAQCAAVLEAALVCRAQGTLNEEAFAGVVRVVVPQLKIWG